MGTYSGLSPIYPVGYKVDHFRQARRLALASAQAAAPLWEFRWGTTAGHVCVIERITLKGVQTGNATAEELRFSLFATRSFTAVDSSNVASILRSGNNQKLSSHNPDSVLTAFVESSGATAGSGGTFTNDSDPIATGSYVTLGTASTSNDGAEDIIFDYSPLQESEMALTLVKNEGWTITLDAQKGATTGFVVYLEVSWAECRKPL